MSWYKLAKEFQELMWDPDPDTDKDDYQNVHKDSDKNAIMEKMYDENKETPVNKLDTDSLFHKAIKALSELGGELNMWKFFIEENRKDFRSEKGQYLENLKNTVRKEFKNFYNKRQKQDNKAIINQPGPPQPPPMGM
jgi:hypothetical protein